MEQIGSLCPKSLGSYAAISEYGKTVQIYTEIDKSCDNCRFFRGCDRLK